MAPDFVGSCRDERLDLATDHVSCRDERLDLATDHVCYTPKTSRSSARIEALVTDGL